MIRGALLALGLVTAGGAAQASPIGPDATFGNYEVYYTGFGSCLANGLAAGACDNLVFTGSSSGVTISNSGGPLVPGGGGDVALVFYIVPINGASLTSLIANVSSGGSSSFGWGVFDSQQVILASASGQAGVSTVSFPNQPLGIEVHADLSASGNPIEFFVITTVPAPAGMLVFAVGLAGLIGSGARRRKQTA